MSAELRTLTIPVSVWAIVGLDDFARYPDIVREMRRGRVECRGTVEALTDLVTEINDRATEGADGYGHNATDKAACRRAVRRLSYDGWKPRP